MELKSLAEWDLSKETGWERLSVRLYAVSSTSSVWGQVAEQVTRDGAVFTGKRRYFRLDGNTRELHWYSNDNSVPELVDEAGNWYCVDKPYQEIRKYPPVGGQLQSAVPVTDGYGGMAVSDAFGITFWQRDYHFNHIIHCDLEGHKKWEIPLAPVISSCQLVHTTRGIAAVLCSSTVTYIELNSTGDCPFIDRLAPFDAVPLRVIQPPPANFGYFMTQAILVPAPPLPEYSVIHYVPSLPRKEYGNCLIRCHPDHRTEAIAMPSELRSFILLDADRMVAIRESGGKGHLVLLPRPDWRKAQPTTRLLRHWRPPDDFTLWR